MSFDEFRWFANLMKFRILKYEYLLLFTFSWEKESLIGQQIFLTNKRSFLSEKKNQNKYSYFKIRNFVKLANHQMTYIQNLYQKISFKCIVYNKYLVYIAYKVLRKSSSRRLSQHQIPSYKTFVMIKFWARPCLYQTISTIYKSDFWLETFTDEI